MNNPQAFRVWCVNMTGEEWEDLDVETQDEMRDLGYDIARNNNVNAIDALAQKFLDAGMLDDVERILALKDDAVTYMQNTVADITRYNVSYNDSVQQWIYDAGSYDAEGNPIGGQFAGKLSFDRTMTDDEYTQAILDKFGTNPIT